MGTQEFNIQQNFFGPRYEHYGEVEYLEGERRLSLSGYRIPLNGVRGGEKAKLNAVFGRFNPPNDDEVIDESHWTTIQRRISHHLGCPVVLNRAGGKLREDVWRVHLDQSVEGIYRWHDNGKEMDLKRGCAIDALDGGLIVIDLGPQPKWLRGEELTTREIARMRSYVAEILGRPVRFVQTQVARRES
jgi:hypothetical protein